MLAALLPGLITDLDFPLGAWLLPQSVVTLRKIMTIETLSGGAQL